MCSDSRTHPLTRLATLADLSPQA
ncbi:MAG: hypothetical protein QOF09_3730, partial [Alphaproteobacteria bacterium]|nr:hypothetical protein [Alphaproteobacteria bacterium]